jgi:two-component system sensor histidine kinase YesM
MRGKKSKSIVNQTILRVSAVFIAAMVIFTIIFTAYISTYMKDNILQSQQEQLEIVANAIESNLKGLEEPLITLSEYAPTTRLLGRYYPDYSDEWMNCIRNLDSYLQNVNMFTEYIIDINLIRTDSSSAYSMRDSLKSDYAYLGCGWFKSALKQPGIVKYAAPHGTDHLYVRQLNYTFSVIYPVYKTNIQYGYIIMECNLEKMADIFEKNNSKEGGFILVDEEGNTIFDHQMDRYAEEKSVLSGRWGDMTEGDHAKSISQKNGKLYSAKVLSANNWTLILESDENIILQPIRQVLLTVVVIGVFVFLLLVGIAIYNAKRMERPINALIERISSYDGSGAETVTEYEEAPREIVVIRDRFEEMADKLNIMINEVYVAGLKQKEMELEALTNQINPHFLYNVFQLIQTKAVLSDNLEIEDMIQALSMMMRYTMERKYENVKIEREVEYIRNYLMFYKARLTDVFDYSMEYEPEILQYETLKFVLQPVVENCFKHAFKDRKSGGIIKISIYEDQQDIYFHVWDNGKGITPERMEQIQRKLANGVDEDGIGIVNTHMRLQLFYGPSYGISISSEENKYTEVIIKSKKKDGESGV